MAKRILVFLLCISAMLSACRESPEVMMEKQLDLGRKYLEDQNYDEAMLAFQLVIDLNPKVLEAYEGIAEVYSSRGKDRDVARVLEQGMDAVGKENISEKDWDIILNLYRGVAEQAEAGRNRERAIELYGRMLELREDTEISARLEILKEEERKAAELENRKNELMDMARAMAEAVTWGTDYDFHNKSILSAEFDDLTSSLTEPYVFPTENGNYIGVYQGGYIYSGAMSGTTRKGHGIWFYGDTKMITVVDTMWDNDLPNGQATIETMINEAKLVKEADHTYALKTAERVPLKDGVYEGDASIIWIMDSGNCNHQWEVTYSGGLMQPVDGENAALCKKCGAPLHADEDVKKLEGI
ncbi:MAG: hypothetical protein IJT43_08175 [Stomatobaculum sp.]|nr:hypothetical protein [Stomatobaculum sp.]